MCLSLFWNPFLLVEGLNGVRGGGPLVGCRLKFSYFVGSRLNFRSDKIKKFNRLDPCSMIAIQVNKSATLCFIYANYNCKCRG